MAVTAVLCVEIGLIQAYLLAEMRRQRLAFFDCGVLILFTLQLGLWRYLSTTARRRRFWLWFEVSGLAATPAG
jgi:hypothetical protein